MSSEENFRRLGTSILFLEEKLLELKAYTQEMVKDRTKFDPNVLMNISDRLISATSTLNQSFKNYKNNRPTQ